MENNDIYKMGLVTVGEMAGVGITPPSACLK
jgi:hypothetical protein